MGIGNNLKDILKSRHLTIKELSAMADISERTLYGITSRDSKTIQTDTMAKICSALDITPAQLIQSEEHIPVEAYVQAIATDIELNEDEVLKQIAKACVDKMKLESSYRLTGIEYKADHVEFTFSDPFIGIPNEYKTTMQLDDFKAVCNQVAGMFEILYKHLVKDDRLNYGKKD